MDVANVRIGVGGGEFERGAHVCTNMQVRYASVASRFRQATSKFARMERGTRDLSIHQLTCISIIPR